MTFSYRRITVFFLTFKTFVIKSVTIVYRYILMCKMVVREDPMESNFLVGHTKFLLSFFSSTHFIQHQQQPQQKC